MQGGTGSGRVRRAPAATIARVIDRAGSADAADLLLAIENERRVEFAFEADRWFDLVRTGRAGAVLGVTDTKKWVFPIPYNDLVADPDLEQNPGY